MWFNKTDGIRPWPVVAAMLGASAAALIGSTPSRADPPTPAVEATSTRSLPEGVPQRPKRAVLLLIDGLHAQAPDRLNLANFKRLAAEGTWFRRAHLVLPYHPTTGDWAAIHNSSMPNPIMLAGTLFIRPKQRLLQDCFYPEQLTAQVANCTDYSSINRSNSFSMLADTTDAAALEHALDLLTRYDIRFMRIHLQQTGLAGWQCHRTTQDVPWRRNIWAEGSPYVAAARNADRLLGHFCERLEQMQKKDDTLLVLTADHGNAPTGGHPPMCEDGWITPLVFIGPGIARKRVLDYAEHIDIAPTICHLMHVEPPNQDGASGRVLRQILASERPSAEKPPERVRELNVLLSRYAVIQARLLLAARENPALETEANLAERKFFGLHRVTEWPQAGSLDHLIAVNREVLLSLEASLDEARPAKVVVGLDRYYHDETRNGRPYHYAWEDTAPSGYSQLKTLIEGLGATTTSVHQAASKRSLASLNIYMIVAPNAPKMVTRPNLIEDEAIEAIVDWVREGGVLVMLHNNEGNAEFEHANKLVARFGIHFNDDTRFGVGADPAKLQMHSFPDHPFFQGVKKLHMRSICTLTVRPPAEELYRFQGDSIMALSKCGKGVVFALGDPWAYNEYIDFFDNHACLTNVFRWLLARTGEARIVADHH
jgi:hypothetical protein